MTDETETGQAGVSGSKPGERKSGFLSTFVSLCQSDLGKVVGAIFAISGATAGIVIWHFNEEIRRDEKTIAGLRNSVAESDAKAREAGERAAKAQSELAEARRSTQHFESSEIERRLKESLDQIQALKVEAEGVARERVRERRDFDAVVAELAKHESRAAALQSRTGELAESLRQVTTDRDRFAAENGELKILLQKVRARESPQASGPYSAEGAFVVPGSFTDSLTGVTIGVSSLWSDASIADVAVTLPDGTTPPAFASKFGTGWKFDWRGRRFIVLLVGVEGKNRVRVAVRETTEPK